MVIAITTRLQDRGEGLTTLPNESVANSIPRQRQLFPQKKLALLDKWVISSTPSRASVEHFYHQTEVKYPS